MHLSPTSSKGQFIKFLVSNINLTSLSRIDAAVRPLKSFPKHFLHLYQFPKWETPLCRNFFFNEGSPSCDSLVHWTHPFCVYIVAHFYPKFNRQSYLKFLGDICAKKRKQSLLAVRLLTKYTGKCYTKFVERLFAAISFLKRKKEWPFLVNYGNFISEM